MRPFRNSLKVFQTFFDRTLPYQRQLNKFILMNAIVELQIVSSNWNSTFKNYQKSKISDSLLTVTFENILPELQSGPGTLKMAENYRIVRN